MKKIIVIGDFRFTEEQKARLEAGGEVVYVESPDSSEEWLRRVEEFDVICSNGSHLLENLPKLKNVFVTYPYIELGCFDSEELAKNGVRIANTQGSNRDSIVEWTMFTILALFRKFPKALRAEQDVPFEWTKSLSGKRVLIVGKGSIGSKVGELCEAFGMQVDFFRREDDLKEKAQDVDLVINALNCNSTSKGLLNENFFKSLKPGSYFVTFARPFTYSIDAVIESLNSGVLAGAGIDCDPESPGDTKNAFYQKCLSHEKILVTPHVAFSTEQAKKNGAEIVIQNIEAFVAGHPQNIIQK